MVVYMLLRWGWWCEHKFTSLQDAIDAACDSLAYYCKDLAQEQSYKVVIKDGIDLDADPVQLDVATIVGPKLLGHYDVGVYECETLLQHHRTKVCTVHLKPV